MLALAAIALIVAVLVGSGLIGAPAPSVGPGTSPGAIATASATAAAYTGEATFVRPTPTPLPTFTSYVVRVGDTLTSIAKRSRTTARSIAWWNRGTYPSLDPESAAYRPNSIRPGWVLVLIPGTTVDENNPPSPSPSPTPAPTTSASATASTP